MDTNKWIDSYTNLNPENRLKIANTIVEWLRNIDGYSDPRYDKEKAKMVKAFFEDLIKVLEIDTDNYKIVNSLKKFEGLSDEHKDDVLSSLAEVIEIYAQEEYQQSLEDLCQKNGHLFGKWEYRKWIERGSCDDPRFRQEHPTGEYVVDRQEWSRTCRRCGFIEKTEYEPEEVMRARITKENKGKIKQLRKELKDLNRKK